MMLFLLCENFGVKTTLKDLIVIDSVDDKLIS